jgi:ATP-dependent RNA helicase RhlB
MLLKPGFLAKIRRICSSLLQPNATEDSSDSRSPASNPAAEPANKQGAKPAAKPQRKGGDGGNSQRDAQATRKQRPKGDKEPQPKGEASRSRRESTKRQERPDDSQERRSDNRRDRGGRRGRSREDQQARQEALADAAPRTVQFPEFGDWTPPEPKEPEGETVSFQNLPIHPRILKALLVDLQFEQCTPIQGLALPHTLAGKDVAGRAQTGTGKTAAFLISIFNRLLVENPERLPHQPYALCIAPTRELAIQIEHDAAEIGKYCGLSTLAVYGGMNYDRQRDRIAAGVDLVAATPGRLLDYVRQKAIDLSQVKVMVIDEADRMLDMGFIPDVRRIIARLCSPAKRQTLLFSATLDRGIMDLAQTWMRPDPVVLEVDSEHVVAENIEEIVYAVSAEEKLALLLWLIKHETWSRILIFRNQRRDVERLYHNLHRYGIHCEMLSGDVPQKKRLRILEAFRKGDIPVVVATDVAGRGIHVDDISHVVNYDFPFEAEDYVHRIGRTGRAGQTGKGISFAGSDCAFVIPEIEEYVDRPLPTQVPAAEMVEMPPAPKGEHGEKPHPRRSSRPKGRPRRSGGGDRGRSSSRRGGRRS